MSALARDLPLEVALSDADEAHLATLLQDDFDAIVTAFTKINAAAAEATVAADRDMIRGWIIDALGPQGYAVIDDKVPARSPAVSTSRPQSLTW